MARNQFNISTRYNRVLGSIPKPKYDTYGRKVNRRRPFKTSTKKKEWNKAAGRAEDDFKTTSKCRWKKERLVWGSRTYDFDHRDNNSANNSQKNCYLLCKNCHGHLTVLEKQKDRDSFGNVTGYKTIKRKVGGKKSQKKKTKKVRRKRKEYIYGPFGKPPKLNYRNPW